MPSASEATLGSFRFSYRRVGRQPLDGENDYAHDPEEDPRILRRAVQWEERQNDQYWTHNPLDPIVQCDRNQFDGSGPGSRSEASRMRNSALAGSPCA